jgi:hypothetical protein
MEQSLSVYLSEVEAPRVVGGCSHLLSDILRYPFCPNDDLVQTDIAQTGEQRWRCKKWKKYV